MIPSLTIKISLTMYFQWSFTSNFFDSLGFLKTISLYTQISKKWHKSIIIFNGGKSKELLTSQINYPSVEASGGKMRKKNPSWGYKSKSTKYIYFLKMHGKFREK